MPYPCRPQRAKLYTAAQTRELDRIAIESGTPGFELMTRAARAAYRALRQRWPQARKLCVLCGPGNNGGDGLVLAGLALEQHQQVEVRLIGGQAAVGKLQGEALEAYRQAQARGVVVQDWDGTLAPDADVVVDALLGTGLSGPVRADYVAAIEAINRSDAGVLAIDLPSGLCSDSGRVMGTAVRADLTVSFIGLKRGLLTHQGVDHCGRLLFSGLEVPEAVYARVPSTLALIDQRMVGAALAPRRRAAHKGDFGHLLVVGGDYGMAGAMMMAARAAARSGAGLVSVATRPEHVAGCTVQCPEVMAHGVRSGQDLQRLLARATVVLIGPGLGRSAWSGQLLRAAAESRLPLVLDADALNMLAQGDLIDESRRDNWILTPHPGEAARLLGCPTTEIQADRFAAAARLQQRFGGVVVLKGAGTLVCDGSESRLCDRGNPGMASGGMGDVLGGILAALLAQRLSPLVAASVAVRVHAEAADREAAISGERGLLATDLIGHLKYLLNPTREPVDE